MNDKITEFEKLLEQAKKAQDKCRKTPISDLARRRRYLAELNQATRAFIDKANEILDNRDNRPKE